MKYLTENEKKKNKHSSKYTISDNGISIPFLKNHIPHFPEWNSFSGNFQIVLETEIQVIIQKKKMLVIAENYKLSYKKEGKSLNKKNATHRPKELQVIE